MTQMFGSFGKQMLLSSWSTFFNVVAKFQSDTLAWFDDKQVYRQKITLTSDRTDFTVGCHNTTNTSEKVSGKKG